MNRKLQIVWLSILVVGYMMYALTTFFRNSLSDFSLGFFEGMSVTFVIIGTAYLVWCLVKKQNPFKIEKKAEQ